MTTDEGPRSGAGRWRLASRAARTRIIGWVLLLVLLALALVTLVTWRLLVRATDERMDLALEAEVEEFGRIVASGLDPESGEPFGSVGTAAASASCRATSPGSAAGRTTLRNHRPPGAFTSTTARRPGR